MEVKGNLGYLTQVEQDMTGLPGEIYLAHLAGVHFDAQAESTDPSGVIVLQATQSRFNIWESKAPFSAIARN